MRRIVGLLVCLALAAASLPLPVQDTAAQDIIAKPPIIARPVSGPGDGAVPQSDGTFLLTVFLRHDESKPLGEINAQLKRQGFYERFPPAGIEVVSWYVMMGIGQVVTLRVPADRLRDVNRVLEETAWGGYRTEFYPTYDYRALAEKARSDAAK
jgi:hypothetical protein